jgi:DUF4097 and DUF4098 domain-containing protein YvlB
MKNRGKYLNILGIILGITTFGIIIFSVAYLTYNRPSKLWSKFDITEERAVAPWEGLHGEERIDVQINSIAVRNTSGNIEIRGWNKDYILVKYVKRGPFAEDLKVNIETSGKRLSVYTEGKMAKRRSFVSVSFDISVPRETEDIEADSVSGSLTLTGISPRTDLKLKTVSGKIETDNSGDLHAKTTSGPIIFRFSGSKLNAETASGSINGDILALDKRGSVELYSVSGSITINAFRDLSSIVNLKSTSGTIHCEFPLETTMQKRNQLEGKIGEGAVPINIKTTSGRIRLEML